jgi:uncharacterized membrane protein YgcG
MCELITCSSAATTEASCRSGSSCGFSDTGSSCGGTGAGAVATPPASG